MLEMCDLLISHASDPDVLGSDPVVQAAAQRWIEVLGEAASHLPAEVRAAHPEIPWREIIGTRVILPTPTSTLIKTSLATSCNATSPTFETGFGRS
jgi:uncharacterized protein with HEPN domain